jgi:osmoprotectant transport system permease protein
VKQRAGLRENGKARMRWPIRAWLAMLALLVGGASAAQPPVVVGSKRFTESYVLGELVRQVLLDAGVAAEHRPGLGNTGILEQALASGAVDVYPEYTGTIARELLRLPSAPGAVPIDELNRLLAPRGLKAAVPLGFNNGYALAMREADAARLGVDSISALARLDAARSAGLRLGLSHEFLVRADGWPALKKAYGLPFDPQRGLDHGLAYEALARGQVDLIDVYTTDAKIARGGLRVLRDDLAFFPRYDAVLLMRATLDERPLAAALQGRIDEATMVALNAQVELSGRPFAEVARGFLKQHAAQLDAAASGVPAPRDAAAPAAGQSAQASLAPASAAGPSTAGTRPSFADRLLAPDLGRLIAQHLLLVFGSLALALAAGVPLGVWAFLQPRFAGLLMGAVGVLQTVPSLALLAFLIAMVGTIGFVPALIALFVYALLPIVRNTHAGLAAVPAGLHTAGSALGLTRAQVLRWIELPLAVPTLLAGVKTAAVINVGTATVAAFIGAGGLGERIVAGLAVNDTGLMMAGAVPSAVLALAVQWAFDALERVLGRGDARDAAAGTSR